MWVSPPQRGFLTGRELADHHHRASLGVQEIGCGTAAPCGMLVNRTPARKVAESCRTTNLADAT
jgi:hypothetical protein